MRGRSFFTPHFVIKLRRTDSIPRFTVTVTTRVAKRAVARNRVKRVLREAIRLHLRRFLPGDYVIIVKAAALKLEAPELRESFLAAVRANRLMQ